MENTGKWNNVTCALLKQCEPKSRLESEHQARVASEAVLLLFPVSLSSFESLSRFL